MRQVSHGRKSRDDRRSPAPTATQHLEVSLINRNRTKHSRQPIVLHLHYYTFLICSTLVPIFPLLPLRIPRSERAVSTTSHDICPAETPTSTTSPSCDLYPIFRAKLTKQGTVFCPSRRANRSRNHVSLLRAAVQVSSRLETSRTLGSHQPKKSQARKGLSTRPKSWACASSLAALPARHHHCPA